MDIGTVISTPDGPSVSGFSFVINDEGPLAKQGQFITLKTPEGTMVARISDIFKSNRYFQRAESVREYEKSGKRMAEIFPVERWEYLIGRAKPLAVFSEKLMQRPCFPPSPGDAVKLADGEMLSKFIGLDPKGIDIGRINFHETPVRLNLTKLLQKHLAILSISGGGKSYLTSVIIEELLERKPGDGQVATVIVDTHGEYIGFAEDEKYRNKVSVITGKDFKIGVTGLSPTLISHFVPDMTHVQERELRRILNRARNEMKGRTYDLTDIIRMVAEDEKVKSSTKDILITILRHLRQTGFFGVSDNPSLESLARQGHATIIDVSDVTSLRKRQMLVSYLGKKLFDARTENRIPPFVFIVEEAHNFAPEGVKREAALSKGIIEKIAREGRKFNASLCLISQRPIQLSTTALSQCNTHTILRVTNPYDLDHIGKSSEGLTRDVLDTVSSLRVGEALIVGEAVNYPIFVKVRERKSRKSERGIPLEEAAVRYHKERAKKSQDAKSFM
ncbi:MAG: ATP-binding protein [archaeon]|nr:MAG: ATP-binding protein [archaeon]